MDQRRVLFQDGRELPAVVDFHDLAAVAGNRHDQTVFAVQSDARGRVRQFYPSQDPPILIGLIDDAFRGVIAAGDVENKGGDYRRGLRGAEHAAKDG